MRRRRRLSAPDVRTRVERFARLFGERHFPLYAPFIEYWLDEGEEDPPWTCLRRGIPFDLLGFGYDGLHEMWHGYRDGLSALVLLARPPDSSCVADDGIRVAWLESAATGIPQDTLLRIPRKGIPLDDLIEAVRETKFEGAAQAASWVFAETGNFFLDALLRRRGVRRVRRPLGGRDHRGGREGVAAGQRPHGLGGEIDRLDGGGPPRPLRRDAGLRPAPAPQTSRGGKRT